MVRWLVIAAHPDPASFSAWMRDAAIASLQDAGAHVDLIDLYAIDFEPSMSDEEHRRYEEISADHPDPLVRDHIDLIARADAMLFVFPTWWGSMPAVMKGWLDRVLLPGVGFQLNERSGKVEPGLRHIKYLAGLTTYGGSQWVQRLVGDGGRTIITRTLWLMTSKRHRGTWLALDRIDLRKDEERAAFVERACAELRALT